MQASNTNKIAIGTQNELKTFFYNTGFLEGFKHNGLKNSDIANYLVTNLMLFIDYPWDDQSVWNPKNKEDLVDLFERGIMDGFVAFPNKECGQYPKGNEMFTKNYELVNYSLAKHW